MGATPVFSFFASSAPPWWHNVFSQFAHVVNSEVSVFASVANCAVKPTRLRQASYFLSLAFIGNPVDILATLNHSISLVSRLREISKNLSEAEFKNLLADLSSELADAKIHIAELKTQLAALAEENRSLKAAAPESKQTPTQKWGCYQFEGEQGLFCTACYDSKGKKSLTNRLSSTRRSCPVCKTVIGT